MKLESDRPQLLCLSDVANALSVSPHTIRSWVRSGRLHPTRICRRLLFAPAELLRFISSAQVEGSEADND